VPRKKSAVEETDTTPKGDGAGVQFWLDEISACEKREKDYRDNGMRVREIYGGEKAEATPMNILFSNTETIAPATYSLCPRPVVRRRYKDDDPVGFAASKAGQRMLEFLLDTNIEGYDTFHESFKAVNLDAWLPGRGVASLKYDADVQEVDDGEDADGAKKTKPVKKPYTELVCPEIRSWDRVYMGFARKWSRVPWIAFEEYIDKAEAKRRFGAAKARNLKFTKGEIGNNEKAQGKASGAKDEQYTGARQTAQIFQIWDKAGGRVVRYVSPAYKDDYLAVDPDPLKLTGFYNIPRPVQYIEKTDDMVPVAPYIVYENQAKELNRLTIRISRITEAIKARGVYDQELGDDIARVMDADDNGLQPADKSSSLAAEKGFQNAIWFMPLDVLITTLRELVSAREQCKQVIYEITGISDIVRGASKASETLGAQEIKSQWGTLRLKPKQAELQRYCCDMLRITLEIAATKFSEETWARMTGLPYLTSQQLAEGQAKAQAAQKQMQMAQANLARLGPPAPEPPPEAVAAASAAQQLALKRAAAQTAAQNQAIMQNQQAAQQAQAELQQLQQIAQTTPKWPEVLASLKDDIQRAYKIDIETNSTIEPEAAEDQKNIADMLTALGQFMQSVGPMIQEGVLPFQIAQSMLLTITRRFRFGDEIEEYIRQMQPPPPKPEEDKSAEALKAAEQQNQQLQGQLQQKDGQAQDEKIKHDAAMAGKDKDLGQRELENAGLKAAQQLMEDRHKLEMDRAAHENEKGKLESDRKLFKQEQQHAVDKITSNVQNSTTKLDAKKKEADTASKQADKQAKDTQARDEQIDKKAADLLDKMAGMLDKMQDIEKSIGEKVTMAKVINSVSGPRKRTIQRGKDGRAESLVDEPMN
jgi:hypothetical protein